MKGEWEELEAEPLEPVVGRVRQSGRVARVNPHDPVHPNLARLAGEVQSGVRRSGVGDAASFRANEAMFQSYAGAEDGISAHRDQSFYRFVIVIFTLEGTALFEVLDRVTEEPVDAWQTDAGDMYVLAGAALTADDRRPPHRVGGPSEGTRLSLTLRMKQRRGEPPRRS